MGVIAVGTETPLLRAIHRKAGLRVDRWLPPVANVARVLERAGDVDVVLAVGAEATEVLSGGRVSHGRVRGRLFRWGGRRVFVTFDDEAVRGKAKADRLAAGKEIGALARAVGSGEWVFLRGYHCDVGWVLGGGGSCVEPVGHWDREWFAYCDEHKEAA